jgi:hypothetical protein
MDRMRMWRVRSCCVWDVTRCSTSCVPLRNVLFVRKTAHMAFLFGLKRSVSLTFSAAGCLAKIFFEQTEWF